MDPRPMTPPPWLPATRPPVPAPPDPPLPPAARLVSWRRLTRSPRGAAGLVIAAAALLLTLFADPKWSWLPWAIGVGALVLLRLMRLDGLLGRWVPHICGLVVVAGLVSQTGPWTWAFAASIGVLLAGLTQLPWWRLAAVGAVLCLVTGAGYGFTRVQEAQQAARQEAQTHQESKNLQGAERPQGVLPILLNRIARGVPGPICDNLLTAPARESFIAAFAAGSDCSSAVGALADQVRDPRAYAKTDAPSTPHGDGLVVDACDMKWNSNSSIGPQLGELTIGRTNGGSTYVVIAFTPC